MKRILIVSKHNACRSAMAEGWLKYYGKGVAEVHSAGIYPEALDLWAANAMMEAVIDITRHQPKPVQDFKHVVFDYVICLSSDTQGLIPEFAGKPEVLWYDFPNPKDYQLDDAAKTKAYNQLRDELENLAFDFVHQKIKPLY
jgi:arsenate reductase